MAALRHYIVYSSMLFFLFQTNWRKLGKQRKFCPVVFSPLLCIYSSGMLSPQAVEVSPPSSVCLEAPNALGGSAFPV